MFFLDYPIPKLASINEPSCAEMETIWGFMCQPAHVEFTEPEPEPVPVSTALPALAALTRMGDLSNPLHGSAALLRA